MEGSFKADKGLLFFYDWEECFDSLPDKECKEMLLAMLRYKKYGAAPPEFTGISKVIASLIFPQLERQIQDFQNGKRGGRPKKREDTNSENKSSLYINKEESPIKRQQDELLQAVIDRKRKIEEQGHDEEWSFKTHKH